MVRVEGNWPVSKPRTISVPPSVPNSGSNMGHGDQIKRSRPYIPMLAFCRCNFFVSLGFNAKSILASVAAKLKESPLCSITITGYPAASKVSQAVCNKRTEAIRIYLMNNEGISADRLSVNCEVGGGDANTIDLKVK